MMRCEGCCSNIYRNDQKNRFLRVLQNFSCHYIAIVHASVPKLIILIAHEFAKTTRFFLLFPAIPSQTSFYPLVDLR